MRVVAGSLGGRTFDSPRTHRTHPMSERIRGAIFSVLGDIVGLSVLDAFSGSGALGIEAVSRGAASVVSVENDPSAQRAIKDNIRRLDVGRSMRLVRAGLYGWSQNNPGSRFDLVLADPPFDELQMLSLQALAKHVNEGGLLVLCWPGAERLPDLKEVALIERKTYGDAQVGFYRRQAG